MQIYRLRINNVNKYFESEADMIRTLLNRRLSILEYDLKDKYECVRDIGYPFPYWEKGTIMSLEDWIKDTRKQIRSTKDKSDLELIYEIITSDILWRKCE